VTAGRTIQADAAVKFAAKIARERGHISEADLRAIKAAGYDDAQIVEIVQHVALNVWTNYMNLVAQTDIDFPVVTANKAH
jgi:alkylhydroperoxidase family enzyme